MDTPTALVTGASKGLGRALATALNDRGWRKVVNGRDAARLTTTVAALPRADLVTAVAGDVAAPAPPAAVPPAPRHRGARAAAAGDRLDLLVNKAGELGPSPLPHLADLRPEELERTLQINT